MVDAKPVEFRGSSLEDLRAFPLTARREAGHQLDRVQNGRYPDDWKPINTVGRGAKEIRIRDEAGAFRVLYVAKFADDLRAALLPEEDRENQQGGRGACRQALPRVVEGARAMKKQRFASVWDAVEDTPEQAANMKLRSELMIALKDQIARAGMSQAQAARLVGVTQPRVSDLMRGKINLFALDALVNMATAAGLRIEMHVLEAA